MSELFVERAMASLREIPWLKTCKEPFLRMAVSKLVTKFLAPEECLAREGEDCEQLILLGKGSAEGFLAKEWVERFDDGAVIGPPIALFETEEWPYSVYTTSFSDCMILRKDDFATICSVHPVEAARLRNLAMKSQRRSLRLAQETPSSDPKRSAGGFRSGRRATAPGSSSPSSKMNSPKKAHQRSGTTGLTKFMQVSASWKTDPSAETQDEMSAIQQEGQALRHMVEVGVSLARTAVPENEAAINFASWTNAFLEEDDEARARGLASWLDTIEFFSTMDSFSLERILKIFEKRTFKKDEPLLIEGEPAEALHVVFAGNVSIMASKKVVAKLGPKSILGERSICILGEDVLACGATVMASSQLVVTLSLARSSLLELFIRDPDIYEHFKKRFDIEKVKRGVASFRNIRLFEAADPNFTDALEAKARQHLLQPGDTLMTQDEPGKVAYLLCRGSVEIIKDGVQVSTVQVEEMTDAIIFGEFNLLGLWKAPRATVKASSPCFFRIITQEALRECFTQYPDESNLFRQLVTKRLVHEQGEYTSSEESTSSEEEDSVELHTKFEIKEEEKMVQKEENEDEEDEPDKQNAKQTSTLDSMLAALVNRGDEATDHLQQEKQSSGTRLGSSRPSPIPSRQSSLLKASDSEEEEEEVQKPKGRRVRLSSLRGPEIINKDDVIDKSKPLLARESILEEEPAKGISFHIPEELEEEEEEDEDDEEEESSKEDLVEGQEAIEAGEGPEGVKGLLQFNHERRRSSQDRRRTVVKALSEDMAGFLLRQSTEGNERIKLPRDLSQVKEFKGLNPEILAELQAVLKPRIYMPQQVMLEQGTDFSHLLVLEQGLCSVEVFGANLEPFRAPCVVGGMAALVTKKVFTNVRTDTTCFVSAIPKNAMATIMDAYPDARRILLGQANTTFQKLCDDFGSNLLGFQGLKHQLSLMPFLSDASESFLNALAEVIVPRLLLPGQEVLEDSSSTNPQLYILFDGHFHFLQQGLIVGTMSPKMVSGILEVFGVKTGKGPTQIKSDEVCQVGTLGKDSLFELLEKFPAERIRFERLVHDQLEDTVSDRVLSQPIFKGMPSQFLHQICLLLERRLLLEKVMVVTEGDYGDAMIVMNIGKAEIQYRGLGVSMLWSGKSFGGCQMLGTHTTYHASIFTKTTCHALILTKHKLSRLVPPGPERPWLKDLRRRTEITYSSELKLWRQKHLEQRLLMKSGHATSNPLGAFADYAFMNVILHTWHKYASGKDEAAATEALQARAVELGAISAATEVPQTPKEGYITDQSVAAKTSTTPAKVNQSKRGTAFVSNEGFGKEKRGSLKITDAATSKNGITNFGSFATTLAQARTKRGTAYVSVNGFGTDGQSAEADDAPKAEPQEAATVGPASARETRPRRALHHPREIPEYIRPLHFSRGIRRTPAEQCEAPYRRSSEQSAVTQARPAAPAILELAAKAQQMQKRHIKQPTDPVELAELAKKVLEVQEVCEREQHQAELRDTAQQARPKSALPLQPGRLDVWKQKPAPSWLQAVRVEISSQVSAKKVKKDPFSRLS